MKMLEHIQPQNLGHAAIHHDVILILTFHAKNFLHLSVILFTRGVCPMACWYTPHMDTRGRHPPGTRGRHTHTLGRHPLPLRHYRIWSTSGWYASNWDAFLLDELN